MNGVVKRCVFRIAAVLLVAVATTAPAHAVERILRFVSDAVVAGNGDLTVTETIRVQAEHNAINHGILRDFPTTYTRRDGTRVVVGFDVQSVTRDGAAELWTTEPLANGTRVRIGRADTIVTFGEHEYVIRYRTTRQIGYFADYDELYWNATGNGWTFAIDVAEARITLPERVPFRQSAFYTGPLGANGQNATIVEQQPGRIVFRTTRALPPYNGLTVAAAWPKGVVAEPTGSQQAGWWLQDNLPSAVAGLGLAGVVAFYVLAWAKVGRDPVRGTIIPLFGPPEGMSAAAVRFVERMGFDDRCFTAAIIDLGVNGHIKLTGGGKQTVIERRTGGKPMGRPERDLESRLFATKPSLLLDQVNYEPIGKAKLVLKEHLAGTYDGRLFADNYVWSGFGLLLSVAVVATTAVLIWSINDQDRAAMLLLGMLVPVLPIAGGAFMIRAGYRRTVLDKPWGALLIACGLILIAVFVFGGLIVMMAGAHGPLDLLAGIAAYIAGPLAFLGVHWLQAPTVEGRAVMDRIEGFRQYLGVAEEDRLNALNPPEKTPELFERFLPYALALDVENRWALRFAAVLAAAGAAKSAAVSTWYQGSEWGNNPVGLANHLSGAFSQTIASASSPPGSSSGSGGGGSSGGGGGGGGGSGW